MDNGEKKGRHGEAGHRTAFPIPADFEWQVTEMEKKMCALFHMCVRVFVYVPPHR